MDFVSFDDVPDNFYNVAYPILKQYNIPFTLYIATGFMDTEGYLTTEQVKRLATDPLCTIGAHTISHPMLKHHKVNLKEEICNCGKVLEGIIGKPVVHFAYPFGTPTAINRRVINFTKKMSIYKSAVITIPGYVNQYSLKDIFALPRIHSKLYMKKYK